MTTDETLTKATPRGAEADSSAPARDRHAIAADGSTFAPGLALLPSPLRADVERLYRVLRTLDDLVDEDDPRASERVGAVEAWARGEPADSPEACALEELGACRPFPRERLLEFCAGMRHDLARAPIADDAGFERYCQQAGGSVGIVLASLLGTVGDTCEAARLMALLGRAMQVTNILRDIDEDLSHGRVYIPRTSIERFGIPLPGARSALLREWIPRADALYDEGCAAIPLLRHGRAAMALSAALYREILRQLERDGFGARAGRAVVPAWRRDQLIAAHRTTTTVLEGT
jgi:phytoene synthase